MEKCFSTISTSKKAKKEINRTKKVSYLFFLQNLSLWRLWRNIFAKKKKGIEFFSLSSALPGVFHPPRTKRRAAPPGLPGLFFPGLWPGSPLPALAGSIFAAVRGSDIFCPIPPAVPSGSRRALPGSIGRRGLALSLSARLRLPPGVPPASLCQKKAIYCFFFGGKRKKDAKFRNAKNTVTQ